MMTIKDYLKEGRTYVGPFAGVSMRPLLRQDKDTVVIQPITGELARYDVALYLRGEQYVLHRVIRVEADHYVIRGDNCDGDEWVKKSDVLGVLTEFFRGKKSVKCSQRSYRVYSAVWVFFYPVRRVFMRLRRKAARCIHRERREK